MPLAFLSVQFLILMQGQQKLVTPYLVPEARHAVSELMQGTPLCMLGSVHCVKHRMHCTGFVMPMQAVQELGLTAIQLLQLIAAGKA